MRRAGQTTSAHGPASYLPRCSLERQAWLLKLPAGNEEKFYGVGAAASEAAALDVARTDAAKSISVQVREAMTDTQTLWSGSGADVGSRDQIVRAASSYVDRRIENCDVQDKCLDQLRAVHVLLACARQGELERQLTLAARKIAGSWTAGGTLLVVPGTDDQGYVTQLGEYAAQLVRDSFGASASGQPNALRLVSSPPWKPSDLHQAARDAGATYLLRIEYLALHDLVFRFSVYVQDVKTDYHVAGADVGFDIALEPAQAALLAVKGPLLPQKGAQDLVNAAGSFAVPLELSKTLLHEGEAISIRVIPPRDGYVYLYDIYEDGRAALLLPSPLSPDNKVHAGAVLQIPDARWNRAGAALTACPLKRQAITREYVKVITSPVPLDLPGARLSDGDLTTVDTGTGGELAAIRDRLAELSSGGVAFGTAEIPYFIQAADVPLAACRAVH